MKYAILITSVLVVFGCTHVNASKFPPMPTRQERSVLSGPIVPVECEGLDTALFSSVPAESRDGKRFFHVFFRTLPTPPYETRDLGVIEYRPDTQEFLQAWIDQDGDSVVDFYFTNYQELIDKFENMCAIVR